MEYINSDYYHSQSTMSFDNRSMPNVNRIRPVSQLDEKWKTSSPSLSSSEWKTSSSQTKKSVESWKMSAKPRHAQLPHIPNDDSSNFRRHSAMPDMMSTGNRPKPLPQEPITTTTMPFVEPFNLNLPPPPHHNNHLNTPPAFIQPNFHQDFSTPIQSHMPQPPQNNYASPYLHNEMMYTADYNNQPYSQHTQMDNYQSSLEYQQQPMYNSPIANDPIIYAPPVLAPSSSSSTSQQQQQDHSPPKANNKEDKKNKKAEKRQITVQSINPEHRVWIDVLPNETGKSLAEKIHIIATFRTRKIVTITSASGRKIPIDNRPVFGNWTDMEKFEDGERWAVEWRANDKSVVDRFFSKVVQGK